VVVSAGETVNVVWEDFTNGNAEVFFRQIRPETGWDLFETRLTQSAGPSRNPAIVSDATGNLHLLWAETLIGQNLSVRFRTGAAQGPTPVVLGEASARWDGIDLVLEWRTLAEWNHAAS
jgi:hypothetical protein